MVLPLTVDPPAPVDCPIGGRYRFIQTGEEEEKYHTRIRGMTVRPRHQIDCRKYVTEFKACGENPKKIYVDAEYCDTVDHTGRPIGEYGKSGPEKSYHEYCYLFSESCCLLSDWWAL